LFFFGCPDLSRPPLFNILNRRAARSCSNVPRYGMSLSLCVCVYITRMCFNCDLRVYDYYDDDDDSGKCSSPCSYRQPSGNGQSLSRRYCKHSGWLFMCAFRTA